jgi:hypothetical protein
VGACIPFEPLAQLANGTEITPKFVNDTATIFCDLPFCSPQTVSLMENTLNQNCVNNTQDQDDNNWLFGVASLYVPFKQGMCQRVGAQQQPPQPPQPPPPQPSSSPSSSPVPPPPDNGTFCITLLTESINAYVKQHPTEHGWDILGNTTELRQYLDGMPEESLCTPCNKAMINPLNRFVAARQLTLDPDIFTWAKTLQAEVSRRCGEGFVDGIGPPDVSVPSHAISSFRAKRQSVLSIPWIGVFLLLTFGRAIL